MNTIKKIITGLAMISTIAWGYKANAQIIPTKISTETSIVSNKNLTGVPMQRLELGNDAWSFKYDYDSKSGNLSKPPNVGMLSLNKVYSKNGYNVGIEAFQVGNFDGTDMWFFDALVTKKFGNTEVMFDYGKGVQKSKHTKDYIIVSVKSPKFSAGVCDYHQGSFFEKHIPVKYFGYGAYHDHNTYISLGNKVNTTYASVGVYGLENFGQFISATKDRSTGNICISSQTAVGNISDFYSVASFDRESDNQAMPAYFPLHRPPLSTKGDIALKSEYKSIPSEKSQELEVMVGTARTPVQFVAGFDIEHNACSTTGNVVFEIYKDFKVKIADQELNITAEGGYNNRTHTATGYLTMKYEF